MSDLRTLRKKLGLTQIRLAELLQTTQQTISEQETGKVPIRRERMFAMRYLAEHPEATIPGQDPRAVPIRIIRRQSTA
jgi:transcriptional regulator with XRE-family HTH domain